MAFADLGSLGATGSTANNQAQLDLTTTAAIATGNLVVVVVAADNIANGGDDNACSGVTLGIGGQALTKGKQIANALAAQAGASSSIWYGIASSALASGGIIRATFGSASLVDASGLTARKFSTTASTVNVEGTAGSLVGNTAADPGSLNVTTASIHCLRVRGIASQVGNNTNLTPTSTWTAWANGNSATTGTTAEMCARAEHLISTGTGAASDPTYVSAIYASTYVALKEVATHYTMPADEVSFALSGEDATFRVGMPVASTSFALTEQDAALRSARRLSASAGSVVLDGIDVELVRTVARQDYTFAVDAGAFALSGQPAALRNARKLPAAPATFALTGEAAGLVYVGASQAFELTAESGAFVWSAADAGLVYTEAGAAVLVALTGAFALTGQQAALEVFRRQPTQQQPGRLIFGSREHYIPGKW